MLDLPDLGPRVPGDRRPESDEMRTPYLEDDKLDLSAWARDAVALELPDKILCRPDCAGLCPVCGKDLNDEPHEHDEPKADTRWAALAELRGPALVVAAVAAAVLARPLASRFGAGATGRVEQRFTRFGHRAASDNRCPPHSGGQRWTNRHALVTQPMSARAKTRGQSPVLASRGVARDVRLYSPANGRPQEKNLQVAPGQAAREPPHRGAAREHLPAVRPAQAAPPDVPELQDLRAAARSSRSARPTP